MLAVHSAPDRLAFWFCACADITAVFILLEAMLAVHSAPDWPTFWLCTVARIAAVFVLDETVLTVSRTHHIGTLVFGLCTPTDVAAMLVFEETVLAVPHAHKIGTSVFGLCALAYVTAVFVFKETVLAVPHAHYGIAFLFSGNFVAFADLASIGISHIAVFAVLPTAEPATLVFSLRQANYSFIFGALTLRTSALVQRKALLAVPETTNLRTVVGKRRRLALAYVAATRVFLKAKGAMLLAVQLRRTASTATHLAAFLVLCVAILAVEAAHQRWTPVIHSLGTLAYITAKLIFLVAELAPHAAPNRWTLRSGRLFAPAGLATISVYHVAVPAVTHAGYFGTP